MQRLKERFLVLLKWLERYTKTDMIYLTKGGFWLGLGQIVASGSAFLISIAFANLLAPETYGVYKYILSVASLISITTLSGMDSAIIQSTAKNFDGSFIPAVKEKMKWGTLGSLISLLVGGYYYFSGNITLSIAFAVVALFMPFAESLDMYNSFLFGKKLFSVQVIYSTIKKIFALLLMVGVLLLTHNIYVIVFAYFLAIVLPNTFLIKDTLKKYKQNDNIDPGVIKYGKSLSAVYVISTILSELDKILVFHYVGAADLAVYTLAVAPTDQMKGILKNLNSLAMPKFSEKGIFDIKKTVWHKIFVLAGSMMVLITIYILLAPIFYKLFFPRYTASIPYSQILSISLIPVTISSFIYTILESQKAEKQIYQYNLYSNLFGILILIPLVSLYGIWGAITARLLIRTVGMGIAGTLIRKI
jgi:O-antigen/teichoic acid export membrane protein